MSATLQPRWVKVANLGDVNPIEYGGLFVYRDATGVYPPEAEYFEPAEDGCPASAYRAVLDRYKLVASDADDPTSARVLVPIAYDATWPHPIASYAPWFAGDIPAMAASYGVGAQSIIDGLCSDDPRVLAETYSIVGGHYGWRELDHYPITLTRAEARRRYRRWLRSGS